MMKKLILGLAALMALTFVSCDDSDDNAILSVDFEDVTLNEDGLANNNTESGSIVSGDLAVTCTWTTSEYGTFGSGFTISNQTDTANAGVSNPYSCIAQSGADASSSYAVFYSSNDSIKFSSEVDMESIMLCNNAYTYNSMLNGDSFSKKFGGIDGTDEDYFKVIVSLFEDDGDFIGDAEFYLADFRGDADYIVSEWTKLDLSTYEDVSYMKFSFESTDNGNWGMNTPGYFCIDNIAYTTEQE